MKTILYLSLADWFWIKQRPHHICEGLSRKNKVFFFTKRSIKKSMQNNSHQNLKEEYNSNFFKINSNLNILRKIVIPLQRRFKIIKKINDLNIKFYLERLDKTNNFNTIIITNPNDIDILTDKLISGKKIIYDCMDNYKKFSGNDENKTRDNEFKLLKIADTVFVSSEDLYRELMAYGLDLSEKMIIVNNGVDISMFHSEKYGESDIAEIFRNDKQRKVCYVGTISDWVDLDLISDVARVNRDISFYFVGPIDETVGVYKYNDVRNMYFTGVQPYESIPNILSNIDIAIMPFVINDLVLSVNPVKIYEYLAMGKPVIASSYPETEKFGALIQVYKNAEEFHKLLVRMLTEKQSKTLKNEMIEFAHNNSWENRVRVFEEYL